MMIDAFVWLIFSFSYHQIKSLIPIDLHGDIHRCGDNRPVNILFPIYRRLRHPDLVHILQSCWVSRGLSWERFSTLTWKMVRGLGRRCL